MNPEQEIVNWWLNKQGYFTIGSIKAPNNKEIDILAIRNSEGSISEVIHIETTCSVSYSDNLLPRNIAAKFDDPDIMERLNQTMVEFLGKKIPIKKMLVIGQTRKLDEFRSLEGITVVEFKEILSDVIQKLDMQNYRNDTVRTLQLMKFILMAGPKSMASLLGKQEDHKILKQTTRETFISELMEQEETRRILEKERYEGVIIELLKNSSLNRPEKIADMLYSHLLNQRTRKKFLKKILEFEGLDKKEEVKEEILRKERPLTEF